MALLNPKRKIQNQSKRKLIKVELNKVILSFLRLKLTLDTRQDKGHLQSLEWKLLRRTYKNQKLILTISIREIYPS
jgi:hypothetical protein